MRIEAISHRIVLAWGVERALLAGLAGAASALAMPPFGLFPVLALTLPVLVWLLDGAAAAGSARAALRSAAVTGWCFGFGYFLAGLWWIGAAFLVDSANFGWLLPIAVTGLPAALALFPALGLVIARALWSSGPARVLALAFGLGFSEWLRGHLLTAFPWNSLGYALADNPALGQAAALIGVDGLTLVAIAVFAAPATLSDDGPRPARPTLLALGALAVLAGYGALRLASADDRVAPDVAIRIVQPNIPQDEKFRADRADDIMARYLALSDQATSPERNGVSDVSLLIWPESAFPFFLAHTPEALGRIGDLLPAGTTLLTGAARKEETRQGRIKAFNSIHLVADDGSIAGTYDKVHLVPFGEFLPFQDWLETYLGLRQLTGRVGGFSTGDRPRSLVLPNGLKLGPLICYEAIFPTGSIDGADRPSALVNVTNDAWFGNTPGPYQHLAQARVRAIEQGLPLLRAANTGISAAIDPYGRFLEKLSLGETGVIDVSLPVALPPTIYSTWGQILLIAMYATLFVIGIVASYRRV